MPESAAGMPEPPRTQKVRTLLVVTENHGWGGAGAYLREVLIAVRDLYDRVVVVSNRGGLAIGDLTGVLQEDGVEHHEVWYPTQSETWTRLSHVSGKLTIAALWVVRGISPVVHQALARMLLRRYRPNAVLCANHGHQMPIWAMMSECGKHGVPCATYLLGMPDAFAGASPRYERAADSAMWRAATIVITNAATVAESHARARGLPLSKVVVIPNGIRDRETPPRDASRRPVFRVGTLGRLSRTKGVHFILEAVRLLRDDAVQVELFIAGEGAELEALRTQARHLGVDSVTHFVGFVPDDAADDFLAGLDAFVLMSVTEGLPFALMEAMRAGLPIVSTRVGGIPEMIEHESNGLLVDSGDSEALADSLRGLAADRDLAARLGEAARRTFEERYTTEVMHDAVRRAFADSGLASRGGPQSVSYRASDRMEA